MSEATLVVIWAIRFLAVCSGLVLIVPELIEWTGLWPGVTATLNSGGEHPLPWTTRALQTSRAMAVGVLLASPYRRIKARWLRIVFALGLLAITVRVCSMIPGDVMRGWSGAKDPLIIPTVISIALEMAGNLWAFAVITSDGYRSAIATAAVERAATPGE